MDQQKVESELEFIKKIMADSRRTFVDNGLGLIVWGILIVLGIGIEYATQIWKSRLSENILWCVVVGSGWIFSIASSVRQRKSVHHDTFAARISRATWIACGISLFLISFFAGSRVDYRILPAFFCMVMAIGMYISGLVLGRLLIVWTAAGWWGACVLMILLPSRFNYLYFGCLMVILSIVPGIVIFRRWKKELDQSNP